MKEAMPHSSGVFEQLEKSVIIFQNSIHCCVFLLRVTPVDFTNYLPIRTYYIVLMTLKLSCLELFAKFAEYEKDTAADTSRIVPRTRKEPCHRCKSVFSHNGIDMTREIERYFE